jgi:hypothetical protein
MRDENDPREVTRFAMTNDPDDVHRLAVIASRNNGGGSRGRRGNPEALTPDELREWTERVQQAAQLARERYVALRQLREAKEAAAVAERRAERADASLRRLQERLDAGGLYAGQRRTPNRPTHVEVDAEAWAVVKRDATARSLTVAAAVGALLTEAVTGGIPTRHHGASDDQTVGRQAQRYARLIVDDATWTAFRAAAVDAAVTTARAVGLVVEAEARRLGWSSTDGHR